MPPDFVGKKPGDESEAYTKALSNRKMSKKYPNETRNAVSKKLLCLLDVVCIAFPLFGSLYVPPLCKDRSNRSASGNTSGRFRDN